MDLNYKKLDIDSCYPKPRFVVMLVLKNYLSFSFTANIRNNNFLDSLSSSAKWKRYFCTKLDSMYEDVGQKSFTIFFIYHVRYTKGRAKKLLSPFSICNYSQLFQTGLCIFVSKIHLILAVLLWYPVASE